MEIDAPFWLVIGNDIRILDSSFCELEFDDPELMKLRINPKDAKKYITLMMATKWKSIINVVV